MGALIGGIIFVLLGLWGLVTWWQLFLKGLMAALPFMFFIGGIIAIAAGISDIKDRMEEQKEKAREKKEEPKQDAEKK